MYIKIDLSTMYRHHHILQYFDAFKQQLLLNETKNYNIVSKKTKKSPQLQAMVQTLMFFLVFWTLVYIGRALFSSTIPFRHSKILLNTTLTHRPDNKKYTDNLYYAYHLQ